MNSPVSSPYHDFEIITSLRCDNIINDVLMPRAVETGQLYMFNLHQDRMLAAVNAFGWSEAAKDKIFELKQYLQEYIEPLTGKSDDPHPLKLRISLSPNGVVNVASTKVAAVTLTNLFPASFSSLLENTKPSFRIFVSHIKTVASPFTIHKTTHRDPYDAVRALIPSDLSNSKSEPLFAEILLVNDYGNIMEGSISTPYFNRGESWITPSESCGGNMGTTRRFALEQGLCREGLIKKETVKVGERIVLSNGVRGYGWGLMEAINPKREQD